MREERRRGGGSKGRKGRKMKGRKEHKEEKYGKESRKLAPGHTPGYLPP